MGTTPISICIVDKDWLGSYRSGSSDAARKEGSDFSRSGGAACWGTEDQENWANETTNFWSG